MHTFCEVLDADVVELLDLLHEQLLLVDLHDQRGVARVAPREPELAERGLELLGDIDGAGLRVLTADSSTFSSGRRTDTSQRYIFGKTTEGQTIS